jgi:hypothetical protein
MYSYDYAIVQSVTGAGPGCEELAIQMEGRSCKAINYTGLTGPAAAGDRVTVNTTAVELKLGSGGYHFVIHNEQHGKRELRGAGHIIKLRYTPMQLRVLSVEEEASPHHRAMKQARSLQGMPVAVAELHSMLAPLALLLQQEKPGLRLAYLMTDGGALPAFFSRTLRELREKGLICGSVTAGQAFGGDLEAVNVYSGLLAAKHVLRADAAVVAMGPGVAGTGTPFGFSGMETADNLNRTAALGGQAVMVPRISFADARERHRGLSHHTLNALSVTAVGADLPLPRLGDEADAKLALQAREAGLSTRHNLFHYGELSLQALQSHRHLCRTMGRSLQDDPAFFLGTAAAARHLGRLLSSEGGSG